MKIDMKRIRLTESDLRRIVNESVKRTINEVKMGGYSFHGNNPSDWAALESLRQLQLDYLYKKNKRKWAYRLHWDEENNKRGHHILHRQIKDWNNNYDLSNVSKGEHFKNQDIGVRKARDFCRDNNIDYTVNPDNPLKYVRD